MGTRRRFNHQKFTALAREQGLRPERLALDLDRCKETIVGYMRGQRVPPTDILLKLCDYFDCEPNDLLVEVDGTEGDPQPQGRGRVLRRTA